ncbi:hypothetical protein OROMI_013287 [Orobanche minor]
MWIVDDFPAYGNLSGCVNKGYSHTKRVRLVHEEVLALLQFQMVGQAAILAYMIYARQRNSTYLVFYPGLTYNLNEYFKSYVVKRLREGNYRIYFIPHNMNQHWILDIIWDGEIYIINSLSHPTQFPKVEKASIEAVKSFNSQTGRSNTMPKVKNLAGTPKQSSDYECGYVVMQYMKDIIEDKEFSFHKKWVSKSRNSYQMEELDEVRNEALGFIEQHI